MTRVLFSILTGVCLGLLMNLRTTNPKLQHESFKPYVTRAIELYEKFGKYRAASQIPEMFIAFRNLNKNQIGVCYPAFGHIEIDLRYWKKATHAQREELLLHELGHCVLDLDHSNPPSIMQATKTLDNEYIDNYNKHINEYFGCYVRDCEEVTWDESYYD
jgi:hypothetical protein